MDASTAIDHALHARDFTDRAKRLLDEAALQAIFKQYQLERSHSPNVSE